MPPIICADWDCELVRELALDAAALEKFLRGKGVDPASDRAKSFEEDLLKVYAKCCADLPPRPPAPKPGPGAGGVAVAAASVGVLTLQASPGSALLAWLKGALASVPLAGWVAAWLVVAFSALAKSTTCDEYLIGCLDNPWQPDWNKAQYGPRKDCGACFRDCLLHGGVWPTQKCP